MRQIARILTALFVAILLLLGGLHSATALAAPTTPTSDFTDNGDGTVTHKTTGLTWKRCAEGQTWSGGTCTGTAATYAWTSATALNSAYAGKTDWRLPTIAELVTLVEHENVNPAINTTIFPGTPASDFWSLSVYAAGAVDAWSVNFSSGYEFALDRSLPMRARLVRGGQSHWFLSLSRPSSDYMDLGDGTVTHTPSGLTWKRCAEGQSWSGGTCNGTSTKYAWAQAAALTSSFGGKSDWRLPTIHELRTLVDYTTTNPTANNTIFPTAPSSFWSASSYFGNSGYAWDHNFYSGYGTATHVKTNVYSVRLVRGGQTSLAVNINGLTLSCPSTLASNASATCTATATYSDSTSKTVNTTWSSSNTSVLTISSGALTAGAPEVDTAVTITATYTENGITKTATATVTVKAAVPALSGLTTSCPTIINTGASGSCTATASYSNGTSKAVSATWSSSNSTALTLSGSSLVAGTPTTDTTVILTASYTENGVTKTATATVIVKGTPVTLATLTTSCPATISAATSGTCATTASYSDGSSKAVAPTSWTSSDNNALSVSGGTLSAGSPTKDTLVTISVSYSEGSATQSASAVVTVKAAPVKLSSLTLSCPASLATLGAGLCSATASYSDGTTKPAIPTSWTSSNTAALQVSGGSLKAGTVTVETPVTISAGYSEGSVAKIGTATITVKAAPAKLTGLTISGDASVKSGGTLSLVAQGAYADNTSHEVAATWVSSDPTSATISSTGLVTAKVVTTDTPVTITASYTENGISQTATWMVTIKATPLLTNLTIGGSTTLEVGNTGIYTASAVYGDGTIAPAADIIWSASGSGGTIDERGVLTASARLTADTPVILTAIYTENGITKTAKLTVTIKVSGTSACSGSGTNLSAITVVGNAIKQPGDSLEVDYCLKNYNSATRFDVYLAVQLPDGTLLFLQSAGFFGTPTFTASVLPYLGNTLIPDKSGVVLQMSVLPMELPTGTYNFYAIPVYAGKDVMNGFNWVGTLAAGKLNFMR